MRLARIGAFACMVACMVAGCSVDRRYEGDRISILPWSLPHGAGTYQSPEGWTYTGEWRKGKREGMGTCVYPNGSTYVGQWEDDKWNGEGVLAWPDGLFLEGVWRDGKLTVWRD